MYPLQVAYRAPAIAASRPADGEGQQLECPDVHTHALGRKVVVPDRPEGGADRTRHEQPGKGPRDREEADQQRVIAGIPALRHVDPGQGRDAADPQRAAGQLSAGSEDRFGRNGQTQCRDREVMTPDPKGRQADDHPDAHLRQAHPRPLRAMGRHVLASDEDRGRVRADAVQRNLCEVDLSAEAHADEQPDAERDRQEDELDDVQLVAREVGQGRAGATAGRERPLGR